MHKEIPIAKDVLEDLYWNKSLKPRQIAQMYGIKNERTVRKKMEKYGIKRRTLSEAMTVKRKLPFSGDWAEKAYLLGLRAGDFHVKLNHESVRIQTSTTHKAQIELLFSSFRNYAEGRSYLYNNKMRGLQWFIYADLHPTFDFLVQKPEYIPAWILEDTFYFYNFLAAYMDCEGNWHISKSHGTHLRFTFRLRTHDKNILEGIDSKLTELGYHPIFKLEAPKGTVVGFAAYTKDQYGLVINRKEEVMNLARNLLHLSKHSEKTRKMSFILASHQIDFIENQSLWNNLQKEIKSEILRSEEERSEH